MIDVDYQCEQAQKLSFCAQDIRKLKRDLSKYIDSLNLQWQGKELKYVNEAVSDIMGELNSISHKLDGTVPDIKDATRIVRERQEEEEAEEEEEKTLPPEGGNTP